MAHLDESKNDFPRDHVGGIDEDFADFYIKCNGKIEIRHGLGRVMEVYIPSRNKGVNILKRMYSDISGGKEYEKINKDGKYYDILVSKLIDTDYIDDIEVLDDEVLIDFNVSQMDFITKFIKPITSGANISPFSKKNLKKTKYTIPEKDVKKYKSLESLMPHRKMKSKNGKEHDMIDGLFVRAMNKDFNKIILKEKGTKRKPFNIKEDKRLKGLDGKEYIHCIGYWDKYVDFVKDYVHTNVN